MESVSGIQILAVLFAVVMSYFSFLSFKRHESTIRELLGWIVVWVLLALVSIFPNRFGSLAGEFGLFRPLDLFTMMGFVVVLSISFYTYINVDRLRKAVEKTIRDLALKDINK